MSDVIVYTLEVCPNCVLLKDKLKDMMIDYQEQNMQAPESITEMRVNGCFAVEAPVLRFGDDFYESSEVFENGKPSEKFIKRIVYGGTD